MSQDHLRNCKFVTEVKYKFKNREFESRKRPLGGFQPVIVILRTQDNQFLAGIAYDKQS